MQDFDFKSLFDYLIEQESSKSVGKILKRIEIFVSQAQKEGRDNLNFKEIDLLKANIKELLYEEFRSIRDAINTGRFVLKITNKSKE